MPFAKVSVTLRMLSPLLSLTMTMPPGDATLMDILWR